MSNRDFINKIAPASVQAMKDHKILASLTIAQAILESAWGQKSIGNNIFGIKANSTWKGKTKESLTSEFLNGKWVKVTAKFRDYDSVVDSIKDHTKLFTTLSRYANLIGETDYKRACYLVWKDGYATDPDYTAKLVNIIESNKLYQYDDDVKEGEGLNASQEAVRQKLMALGITDGKDPQANYYLWSLIANTLGFNKPETPSSTFAKEVAKAKELNISDGSRPWELATRQEVIAMQVRTYEAIEKLIKKG